MKTCRTCSARENCTKLCQLIEGMLPKDDTGRDSHREVSMSPEAFEAVLDRHSYSGWHHSEVVSRYPKLDLSKLSPKEKKAVTLIAGGCSQSEAAARLKITRSTLQTHLRRAFAKLRVIHFEHLIEGGGL